MTANEFNEAVNREIRRLIADGEREYVEREYPEPTGEPCVYADEIFEPVSCNIEEEARLDAVHRARDQNRIR